MGLDKQTYQFIAILFIGLLTSYFILSCEEDIFAYDVDCNECYIEKPDSADLIIQVTINEKNKMVPLTIYKDKVENNDIEYIDTAYTETYYLYVPVDRHFSVVAEYNLNDSVKIRALDGAKIKVKIVTDVCTEDCWIIRGGELDVRLKY